MMPLMCLEECYPYLLLWAMFTSPQPRGHGRDSSLVEHRHGNALCMVVTLYVLGEQAAEVGGTKKL